MANDFVSEIDNFKVGDEILNHHEEKGKLTRIIRDNMKYFEEQNIGKHAIYNGVATGIFEAWLWKFDIKKAKQNEEKLAEIRKILE